MMLTIELPSEIEQRVTEAARQRGVSAEALALDAILERLEDIEDIAAAEAALQRIEAGEKTIPLEEIVARYGLAGRAIGSVVGKRLAYKQPTQ